MTNVEIQAQFEKLWIERRVIDEIYQDVIKHALLSEGGDKTNWAKLSGELSTLSIKIENQRKDLIHEILMQDDNDE
jgi:hypothetical protein